MRLIDADAFNELLDNAEIEAVKNRKYVFASAINVIRGNLANMPNIDPYQYQWIPVSERLPEKQMDVIVTVSFDDSIFADSDEWRNEFCAYGKYVVAWMPLPEPYKGEEDG